MFTVTVKKRTERISRHATTLWAVRGQLTSYAPGVFIVEAPTKQTAFTRLYACKEANFDRSSIERISPNPERPRWSYWYAPMIDNIVHHDTHYYAYPVKWVYYFEI